MRSRNVVPWAIHGSYTDHTIEKCPHVYPIQTMAAATGVILLRCQRKIAHHI